MKKICSVIFFFILALPAWAAESSGKSYKSWLTLGYAYSFPGSSSYSSFGPVTLGIGTTFLKFLALELDISYVNYSVKDRKFIEEVSGSGGSAYVSIFKKADIHAALIRPYLMIRPEIPVGPVSLFPYIGVGAVGRIAGEPHLKSGDGYSVKFDGGAAGKIGFGFSWKRLLITVDSEYLMMSNNTDFSSGFTLGANVGFRF